MKPLTLDAGAQRCITCQHFPTCRKDCALLARREIMDNNYKIALWAGWERGNGAWYSVPGIRRTTQPPLVDELHYLWDNVLFPLIEERRKQSTFIEHLCFNIGNTLTMTEDEIRWRIRLATPPQLAEALVKVIDEDKEGKSGTRGKINSSTILIGKS